MNTMNGYAKNILSDSYVLTSAGGHSLAGGYRNYSNISNGEEWITRSWGQYYAEIERFDTATLLEQSHGHTQFIYRLYVDNTEGTQAVTIRYQNYQDDSNRGGDTGNSIAAGSEGWLWMPVTVDANRSRFQLLLNHSSSTTSSVKVRYVTLVKNFGDILDWTINPSLTSTEEFIVGTQTAATGSWTGVTRDANLYHGKKIIYWLPYNGSGDASLNLTLSGDTTTGAIPIYKSGTSRVTTHYSAGSAIRLIYLVDAKINGASYTGWWADADYTDGNTYTSAYCGTSAGTAAKTATCTNYKLLTNSYLHLTVVYANTSQTALTLNVNSQGAKPIFINGVVSSNTNYTLPAGTYLAFYDGYNYYINTDGTIPKYEKVFNKFYSQKQSVTMNTTLATWYIKIELAGYAQPTQFLISGNYNNNTDRAIIETSGMSGGYIFRNVNQNSGNITGLWFKSNNDSTEKRWIFWVRLRAIQDSSTSHYSPSSSATYTVYLGDSIANFKVTATTTEPSGAIWETVGTDATNIFIKNGTISNAINATTATTATKADKLFTVSKTAWGQTYWTDGGIPTTISGDMSNVGNVNLTGNITIDAGNTDKFINFYYSSGAKLSWRIGYLGTGYNDANYLVIQSNKSDGASWNNVLQLGCTTLNAVFGGSTTATSFIKSGSSDSYVLLGGGGHKALSEFNTSFDYLPLSGGTVGNNSSPAPLYINGNSNKAFVKFLSGTTSLGGLGFNAANKPIWVTGDSTEDVDLLYAGCNATVKTLTITDTSNSSTTSGHLKFSRGSYNYISAPANGIIGFCVNGATTGASANCELVIQDGSINPGTTNVTSLGTSSLKWSDIYSIKVNGYELDAACAKGVTDSSSASAISTGTDLVTERDVYYGLPTINNSHSYTSSTSIYAPTAGGTSGYYLKGNGTTAAPVWQQYSSTPTASSTTLITSGGVYTALKGTLTPLTSATYTLGTDELRYKTGYFSNTLIVGATGMTGSTSGYAGCTFGSAGNMELVGLTGTSGPKIDFHYNKSTSDYTTQIIEQSLGNLYIKGNLYVIPTTSVSGTTTTYSATAPFYINSSGAFWTSDRRFKTDIKPPVKSGLLEDETGFIRKFRWKENGNSSYGYIAQELLQQIPEAVDYDAELNKYSVNYDVAHSAAIAQLVIKIKELEKEINQLKLTIINQQQFK